MLKLSLQTVYARHHDLVDRYEISFFFQMEMNLASYVQQPSPVQKITVLVTSWKYELAFRYLRMGRGSLEIIY
jgi:hypothetical protein